MPSTARMMVRKEPARLRLARMRRGRSGLDTLDCTSTNEAQQRPQTMTSGTTTLEELQPSAAASPSP